MSKFQLLLWLLALPLASQGQPTLATPPLTLPQALAVARTNYPTLRARQAGVAAGIDSSSANAEASRAQLQLLLSRQQAHQQRMRLAGLLGTPAQQ